MARHIDVLPVSGSEVYTDGGRAATRNVREKPARFWGSSKPRKTFPLRRPRPPGYVGFERRRESRGQERLVKDDEEDLRLMASRAASRNRGNRDNGAVRERRPGSRRSGRHRVR